MKLKFINLLLASGLLIGSAQVFTSCKDNESDLVADLTQNADAAHKQLSDRIDKNEQDIKSLESNLKGLISALEAKLDQKTKELEDAIKANSNKIEDLVKDIAGIKGDITVINGQITKINQAIETINGTLTDYGTRIATLETTLLEVQATLNNLNNDIKTLKDEQAVQDQRLDALEKFQKDWETLLPTIQQNAADALAKANANAAAVEALQKAVDDLAKKDINLQEQIDKLVAESGNYATLTDLNNAVVSLQEQAADYYTAAIGYTNLMCTALGVELKQKGEQLNNLQNAFEITVEEFTQKIEILTLNQEALRQAIVLVGDDLADLHNLYDEFFQQFQDLKDALPEMIAQLTSVDETIAKLTNRIEDIANRITSIEINQVHNPVLGSLNTPLGVNTDILMAFVGDAARYCFPATSNGYTYNNQATALTSADLDLIKKVCGTAPAVAPQTNVDLVLTAENGEAYLGEVYVTLNPSNINLDKYTFSVAKSGGDVMPINLALTPSDKDLTFGYSRTQANGFYSAAATIPADQLSSIRFVFNNDLKAAVKNILSDPAKAKTKTAIAQLAQAVMNQLNGVMPALGVQASWSEDNNGEVENHCVTSKYQMAATAVNPLSYQFMANASLPQIPNLPDLNWFKNWVNHWFDTMTGYVHINLGHANVNIEHAQINGDFVINIAPDLKVTVTIPAVAVDIDGDGVADGTTVAQDVVVSLNDIKKPIEDTMHEALDKIAGELQTNVDELIDNLASQIQGIFDDLNTTVNTQIQDILATLQQQINMNIDVITNRIGNYYDMVQGAIDRLNGIISNPNHYLQPTLLYMTDYRFGQLSNIPGLPTQFILGSGNAVMLMPTSLTAELVAPAYQKYIAVTNVYKAGDSFKSAANGDAKAVALMKAANAQQYMNDVIPGEIKAVPLLLDGAKGYCYEIVYQASDYSGKVSDRKFYVVVK